LDVVALAAVPPYFLAISEALCCTPLDRALRIFPMSLETEAILDRRRLKRSTSFWRTAAIGTVALAAGAFAFSGDTRLGLSEPHQIARITIEGMITEDRAQLRMLKRIADNKNVDGVILVVNSPGGTTTGGEALFEALRKISEKKPIASQFGTVAASAGYIVGLGTDYIVSRGNTITGSVGVIMQWPEFTELLAKVGVKMNEVKSGPLKATPSPFQPLDDQTRALTQTMIMEGQRWFLDLVTTRRGVKTAEIPGLEQGRVFSGREAFQHKLVDELGGEAEVVRWLEEKRKVKKGLRIVDWKPRNDADWSLLGATSGAVSSGLAEAVRESIAAVLKEAGLSAISLDGLVSVWHPGKN
jgi:protease IV